MKSLISVLAVSAALVAGADIVDRPSGLKFGERLTLRPYVSLSYTYDSNVDSTRKSKAGSSWVVNPGLTAEYLGENWQIGGSAWYQYHAYNNYTQQRNSSSYGESLSAAWSNSAQNERGWSLLLTERFEQIAQDDDMSNYGGRGIGRDRKTFQFAGTLERRINEYWHGNLNGSYYMLDYDNDLSKYGALYGWKRTVVGMELGYAPSPWTDFIFSGNYQWYDSDNTDGRSASDRPNTRYARDSRGLSAMAGIATRATERISYRLLTGWSSFEYGDGADDVNGWTYELSGSWKMTDNWNMMALASSYYQPSERYYGAVRVDSVSWGLGHSLIRGKLTTTLDLNYRREDHVYTANDDYGYEDNYLTGRLALNYTVNRFLQAFGRVEYQTVMTDGGNVRGNNYYDYDRFRGTIGLRLTY